MKLLRCKDYKIVQKLIGTCGMWVQVETYGNVLTATAFLQGLSSQELSQKELNYCDPSYQVLITVRAVKPGG